MTESSSELRSAQQTDDCISDHARRIVLLEGRIGSYADAELAYRQAAKDLKDLRATHVTEHSQMLTSAKNILETAVTRATDRFTEPLAVVAEIRGEQKSRADERKVLTKYYKQAAWVGARAVGLGVIVESLIRIWQTARGH